MMTLAFAGFVPQALAAVETPTVSATAAAKFWARDPESFAAALTVTVCGAEPSVSRTIAFVVQPDGAVRT